MHYSGIDYLKAYRLSLLLNVINSVSCIFENVITKKPINVFFDQGAFINDVTQVGGGGLVIV